MNLAVMAYSFSGALAAGEMDLPAVIRRVRDMGVSCLELMDRLVRPEELPAVRAALAETGVTVVCYDLFCDAPGQADGKEAVARAKAKLQQAAMLGAKYVMAVPGLPGEGVDPLPGRKWYCDILRGSLPEASRLGLKLTVENLGILAEVYGRSEQLLGICEAVGPDLRVTYDAGNFLLASEDNLEALDRLAGRVAHVHFKDWKVVPPGTPSSYPGTDGRLYQGTALGDGIVNLRGAVGRLDELGYAGAISVEYEGPGDPEEAVRRGVAHLRALLRTAS
jgi:sugar phosphate isomerase/epimerase